LSKAGVPSVKTELPTKNPPLASGSALQSGSPSVGGPHSKAAEAGSPFADHFNAFHQTQRLGESVSQCLNTSRTIASKGDHVHLISRAKIENGNCGEDAVRNGGPP